MNRTRLGGDDLASEMNLTYDLAEGHNITLQGSMNETSLPEGSLDLLLSLWQTEEAV